MYDKCYFCLHQLPKLKKESTASFFVNFGGAGVQKSRPTLLYKQFIFYKELVAEEACGPGRDGGRGAERSDHLRQSSPKPKANLEKLQVMIRSPLFVQCLAYDDQCTMNRFGVDSLCHSRFRSPDFKRKE